jgi:hypothetical protein
MFGAGARSGRDAPNRQLQNRRSRQRSRRPREPMRRI